jgi:cytochrome c oxidase assembly protein subunit 15
VVTRPLAGRLGLLFVMGGTQGLVGWWMVKSGLHVSLPRVT